MNNQDILPCFNCITFPICLNQFMGAEYMVGISELLIKCSLLRDYSKMKTGDRSFHIDSSKIRVAYKYFEEISK